MPHLQNSSLWRDYRASRSLHLRNKIAKENLGLVYDVANRWTTRCAESTQDLEQIGSIGLIKAIERFDPSTGNAFSSFAVPYINGEILHYLRDHWGLLKVPRKSFEDVAAVKKIQRQMARAGRTVELVDCAAALGISAERWQWIWEATQRRQLATLDEIPEIADTATNERAQAHRQLKWTIANLPANQRRAITMRYFANASIEAIARKEKQSPLTVEQWIERAQQSLRDELEELHESAN